MFLKLEFLSIKNVFLECCEILNLRFISSVLKMQYMFELVRLFQTEVSACIIKNFWRGNFVRVWTVKWDRRIGEIRADMAPAILRSVIWPSDMANRVSRRVLAGLLGVETFWTWNVGLIAKLSELRFRKICSGHPLGQPSAANGAQTDKRAPNLKKVR